MYLTIIFGHKEGETPPAAKLVWGQCFTQWDWQVTKTKTAWTCKQKLNAEHWRRSASTAADHRSWCETHWRKTDLLWRTAGCESPQPGRGTVCSDQQVPVRETNGLVKSLCRVRLETSFFTFLSFYLSHVLSEWPKIITLILKIRQGLCVITR